MDLDFGGANLPFFGAHKLHPGIGDFLQARTALRIEKFWAQPVKESASLLINIGIKDLETGPASGAAARSGIAKYPRQLLAESLGRFSINRWFLLSLLN